jgi:uncharacterized membrane protein YdbT with pleckstrin-like domain
MGKYIEEHLIKDEKIEFETKFHWIIFINIWVILVVPVIASFIKYISSEFAITSKRVIMKTGLVNSNTFEMNLSKIESVNVNQSILGKMLDYGTVTFIGTGSTRETFNYVSKPMEFRRKFQELT